ncbi:hypothetical protein [Paenibacillus sp. B01]|uniref:hypothetical protein n=1 Tax=Paenibacillus sp. B01 TaxID=2660554 RepID=UPI00129AA650|nr:hypothetical protein [Paenibacillus sp. B01]QGG56217.1 hypothetical protein GE073_11920 [Paenibacillus sp. B01]
MKKRMVSVLMMMVLALALAVPAFAGDQNYQFAKADGTTSHASGSIEGPAVVTGSAGNYTVTIKLKNSGSYGGITLPASYGFLNADLNGAPGGDGTYEVTATKTVSGGYTYFTFSGLADSTFNVPVQLQTTVAGIHSSTYSLTIDWL